MDKETVEQYPLRLKKDLMDEAKEKAKEEDIPFSQWLKGLIKKALK